MRPPFRCPTDPKQAVDAARSSDATVDQLGALAGSKWLFVRQCVASHPNATPELLSRLVPSQLVSDEEFGLARSIASNLRTAPKALVSLMGLIAPEHLDGSRRENWRSEHLAIQLLVHPSFPATEVERVLRAQIVSRDVRLRIAQKATQLEILSILCGDESEKVRDVAYKNLQSRLS